MDWETVINAAAAKVALSAKPPPALPTDAEVADLFAWLAARGYEPCKALVEPLRWYLSERGVMLRGNTGVGKTLLFKTLRVNVYNANWIARKPFEELDTWLDDVAADEICIDDLGNEQTVVQFGQRDEPLRRVINHRADNAKVLTHCTTNLGANQTEGAGLIRQRYGDPAFSRLLGMCKPFELTGPDRRIMGGAR
jgi:DNA replication protein DnaC